MPNSNQRAIVFTNIFFLFEGNGYRKNINDAKALEELSMALAKQIAVYHLAENEPEFTKVASGLRMILNNKSETYDTKLLTSIQKRVEAVLKEQYEKNQALHGSEKEIWDAIRQEWTSGPFWETAYGKQIIEDCIEHAPEREAEAAPEINTVERNDVSEEEAPGEEAPEEEAPEAEAKNGEKSQEEQLSERVHTALHTIGVERDFRVIGYDQLMEAHASLNTLKEADPGWVHSSSQFRHLRKTMEEFTRYSAELANQPEDYLSAEEMAKSSAYYDKMITEARAYLEYKGQEKNRNHSPLEDKRIDTVTELVKGLENRKKNLDGKIALRSLNTCNKESLGLNRSINLARRNGERDGMTFEKMDLMLQATREKHKNMKVLTILQVKDHLSPNEKKIALNCMKNILVCNWVIRDQEGKTKGALRLHEDKKLKAAVYGADGKQFNLNNAKKTLNERVNVFTEMKKDHRTMISEAMTGTGCMKEASLLLEKAAEKTAQKTHSIRQL